MKFSEIAAEQWEELTPYLDTCLLPVTGLCGSELPYEVTTRLERLGSLLELVEQPFHGRVVTYPALHYISDTEAAKSQLAAVIQGVRQAGFRFVIVAAGGNFPREWQSLCDVWLSYSDSDALPDGKIVSQFVREMWTSRNDKS